MIRTVKTKDLEMNYIKFGQGGRTLVIIPGLSVKSVLLSEDDIVRAYDPVAKLFTVYLFDRRTDMPKDYKIRDMAADTAAAMKAAGIEKADVFGVSQGGMIAQFIAIDHPELVNSLVLGSTSSRVTSKQEPVPADRLEEKAREFLSALYSDDFIKQAAPGFRPDLIPITDGELRRFAISVTAGEGFNAFDELDRIKCRTLVIGAVCDTIVPPGDCLDIAEKLKCELYMYGAPYGHAVYDEAPDYKDRLIQFLTRE